MKEENRMMQDEMMNEEEIIGKEIENIGIPVVQVTNLTRIAMDSGSVRKKSWKILRKKILKKMRRKKK